MNNSLKFSTKIALAFLLVITTVLPYAPSVKLAFTIDEEWEFAYTGDVQTWTVPEGGKYKIEAYGAQGASNGGKGGKAQAIFDLYEGEEVEIIVGGQNGFKGGGTGSATGGGATSVSLGGVRYIAGAGGGGGSGGTAGGTGNGAGGTSVGSGAGGKGVDSAGGGRSPNYTYETGYYQDTGYNQDTGYYQKTWIYWATGTTSPLQDAVEKTKIFPRVKQEVM